MDLANRIPQMTFADLEFVSTKPAGLGWLRSKMGAAGLYGRGLTAETERQVRAAQHGLHCGWCEAGDQGEMYTGAERACFLAGLSAAGAIVARVAA
jgi:DNA-binding helix-hairpin-helix protein with protein kinase domain